MDGLSAVASTIAVIQITESVVTVLWEYYQEVQDARDEIQSLRHAAGNLHQVLVEIEGLARSHHIDSNFFTKPNSTIKCCKNALGDLKTKLGSPKRTGRLYRLVWPFKKGTIDLYVRKIEEHKSGLAIELNVKNLASSICQLERLDEVHNDLKALKEDNDRQSILAWLDVTNTSKDHNDARGEHEECTGLWLLHSKQLWDWMLDERSFLWINGTPGFGKTILCSTVIHELQSRRHYMPKSALAYWYFTFRDPEKQSVTNCLSSLAAQILNHCIRIPDAIRKNYNDLLSGHFRPSVDCLVSMIDVVLKEFEHVYICIDALDECPKEFRLKFLPIFSRMLGMGSCVHIFVTSRDELDIRNGFEIQKQNFKNSTFINLTAEHVGSDISLFLQNQLTDQFCQWPEAFKQEVEQQLLRRSQGMFRLAALQIAELIRRGQSASKKTVRCILSSFPRTLDSFYDRMLLDIDESHVDHAIVALQLIALSPRKLQIDELCEGILVRPESEDIFDPDDRFTNSSHIFEIFPAGLITADDSPRRLISFAHYSVLEYLFSDRIAQGPASDYKLSAGNSFEKLAEICLSYMCFLARKIEPPTLLNPLPKYELFHFKTEHELDSILEPYPFSIYACGSWPFFFQMLNKYKNHMSNQRLTRLLLGVTRRDSPFFLFWKVTVHMYRYYGLSMGIKPPYQSKNPEFIAFRDNLWYDSIIPLGYVIRFGLSDLARLLLDAYLTDNGFNLLLPRLRLHEKSITLALETSAYLNQHDVIDVVLDYFPFPEEQCHVKNCYFRALEVAGANGDLEAFRPLYERLRSSLIGDSLRSLLGYVVFGGNLEIFKMIEDFDVEINTSLILAGALRHHTESLGTRTGLEYVASETVSWQANSPLSIAAWCCHKELVSYLIERNALPNLGNPLLKAVVSSQIPRSIDREEIILALLRAGANSETVPLSVALFSSTNMTSSALRPLQDLINFGLCPYNPKEFSKIVTKRFLLDNHFEEKQWYNLIRFLLQKALANGTEYEFRFMEECSDRWQHHISQLEPVVKVHKGIYTRLKDSSKGDERYMRYCTASKKAVDDWIQYRWPYWPRRKWAGLLCY